MPLVFKNKNILKKMKNYFKKGSNNTISILILIEIKTNISRIYY